MSYTEKAQCRLCADLKPYRKLVDLQMDERRRQKVMDKLIRLSLEVTNLNATNDTLPKTICFPCMVSLDMSFDFVLNVETSQSELKMYTMDETLKQKALSNDNVYDTCEENYDEPAVKLEVDFASEPQEDIKTANNNTYNTKNLKQNTLNTLPLTQLLLSWKEYSWLCAHCDTIFSCIEELKEHSMQYHGCCNPYRCSDCNIRKLNLDNFIKHVKQHRKPLKLSCYKCNMIFSRPSDAHRHKVVHMDSEHRCPGCNETFTTNKQSIEHCKKYHQNKRIRKVPIEHLTDDFTCVFCQKKFKDKVGLTQHLLIHTNRQREYICEICGKCFLHKSNLAGHMMLHEGSRPHQCEICKHYFRTLGQLRIHIGIHEGIKPFSCEQCGRNFRLKRQLNSHSIIHTDSLPYVCTYCQKGFRFKTILNQHLRQHTGIRPYKCEICNRDFTNWPNYNKHMKRRHNMNMAKRKHTPEGLLRIKPTTSEVNVEPETVEWKKTVLDDSDCRGRSNIDCNVNIKITRLKK